MPGTSGQPARRADIQGLRAVAVLVVVLYHAHVGFSGGFVGVDVFFVISGFVITQLLWREAETTGRTSFRDFYSRRVKRILPALAVMLAVVLPASTLLAAYEAQASTARTGIAAALFGLWHILPSLSLGTSNDNIAENVDPVVIQVSGVVVSVVATATVAMGLSWMRNRSDSVVAPATLHATNNSAASLAAWIAQRIL